MSSPVRSRPSLSTSKLASSASKIPPRTDPTSASTQM